MVLDRTFSTQKRKEEKRKKGLLGTYVTRNKGNTQRTLNTRLKGNNQEKVIAKNRQCQTILASLPLCFVIVHETVESTLHYIYKENTVSGSAVLAVTHHYMLSTALAVKNSLFFLVIAIIFKLSHTNFIIYHSMNNAFI